MKQIASTLCIVMCLAASSAQAQGKPAFKHDTKEPIEVTSDSLEVFQEENKAIFVGHVVAIQGEVRLKADSMTVFYRADEKQGEEKPKQATPEGNAIEKIDAAGSVFLSTPEETASGAKGVYDVKKEIITLDDNVVLTRGQNVLKGNHLVYSFATGKSVMSSGNTSAPSVDGKPKQRVRALFVPGDKGDQKK